MIEAGIASDEISTARPPGAEITLRSQGAFGSTSTGAGRGAAAFDPPAALAVLEVTDDGPPVGEVVEGYGLRGMRERAAAVGGVLTAVSGPGGFRVRLEVPR